MLTKFIAYCLIRHEQGDWSSAITAVVVCSGLLLSLFLIPLIIVGACVKAMFIK